MQLLFASIILPLASGSMGFWLWLGILVLILWLVMASAGDRAREHRKRMEATNRKRCSQCQTLHPGFASYCRHCGGRF
jgi:cyanate permease